MEESRRIKVPTDEPLRFAASRASIRKPTKYALFSEDTADKVTVNRKDKALYFKLFNCICTHINAVQNP